MRTMLITGHRGLLGAACVRHFAGFYDVRTIGEDLLNEERVRQTVAALGPDVIINCAARVGGVKANRDNPVSFMRENLRIQNNMIDAAADSGVETFIHIGTSCMFPRDAVCPVSESSLLTGAFEGSVEAYAIAKLAGWRLCKAYHEEHGLNFLTVCPSNIYGPGDNYGPTAHVIPALIRKLDESIKTGAPFSVWGDGSAVREFIHVADVAAALETIIDKWKSPEVINIGTGTGNTIRELVDALVEASGADIVPVWDTSQPTGIPRKTFNVDKLRELGWEPRIGLKDGLLATWAAYRANPVQRGVS